MHKKQVILIRGWEVKENYKDFYDYIEKIEFDPYKEVKNKWSKWFRDFIWNDFDGITVDMPNKEFSDYKAWKIMFEKVFPYLKDDIIFIGHSLWWSFLSKYFNEENIDFLIKRLKKIILIAPASRDIPWDLIWSFWFNLNMKNLKEIQEKIVIFHSKDDFVVPFEHMDDYRKVLKKSDFRIFEDNGHFLDEDFPELIEEIKK